MYDSKKKIKRVLIFSVAYFPHVGGAEIAWKEITDRISDISFEMITARLTRGLKGKERIGNILVHRVGIGIPAIDKLLLIIWGPIFAWLISRRKNFDFSVGLMYSQASLAATLFKLIAPKTCYLLNLQDGDSDEYINQKVGLLKPLLRNIYTRADKLTVIAHFLEKRARDNKFTGQSYLIPNGVDLEKFIPNKQEVTEELRKELGFTSSDRIIITTSRLNYKNAIDDVIQSLSHLPENYHFIILGEGSEEKNLRELANTISVTARVTFLGFKPHTEIIAYLSASDFFCRPSIQEGLGNSFLEAMAMNLPVIATPVGGIPDFLTDGLTGVFCAARNPQSIAKAILRIESDPLLRSRIIKNARNIVFERYDWRNIAKQYKSIFFEKERL